MVTKEEVFNLISDVMHPAINFSLLKLGIVKDIEINESEATVIFAFPFPNIPIAEILVNSVAKPIISNGINFNYRIVLMTNEEKNKFLELEQKGWKG